MQEAQYDFLHGQTDRSDFFSPAMQQLCGIMKDNQVALPSDIGEGYFRYISPCPNIEMYICDVMFTGTQYCGSKCIRILFPSFSLFPTHWSGSLRAETKNVVGKGDCCVYGSGLFDAENIYEAGQRYIGVGLNLHPCRFRSVMDGLQKKKACTAFSGGKNPPKHRITATIEATIRQILQCNYNDCAKSLYQEGKILELVAAFANEMMDQNSVAVKGSLSRADSETLLRVRRQIDEGFLEPVTIAELSKQHFMCESKLREIFRKHYGITIYQYMLNRRMEHACELLSVPDAQVKDIAGLVGYSNISHFSDAFRKKFGCTPSEYKRSLPF